MTSAGVEEIPQSSLASPFHGGEEETPLNLTTCVERSLLTPKRTRASPSDDTAEGIAVSHSWLKSLSTSDLLKRYMSVSSLHTELEQHLLVAGHEYRHIWLEIADALHHSSREPHSAHSPTVPSAGGGAAEGSAHRGVMEGLIRECSPTVRSASSPPATSFLQHTTQNMHFLVTLVEEHSVRFRPSLCIAVCYCERQIIAFVVAVVRWLLREEGTASLNKNHRLCLAHWSAVAVERGSRLLSSLLSLLQDRLLQRLPAAEECQLSAQRTADHCCWLVTRSTLSELLPLVPLLQACCSSRSSANEDIASETVIFPRDYPSQDSYRVRLDSRLTQWIRRYTCDTETPSRSSAKEVSPEVKMRCVNSRLARCAVRLLQSRHATSGGPGSGESL